MNGISEYINSQLAEDSTKLRITDHTSVSHTCSTGGQMDGGTVVYPSTSTFLPALPCSEPQSIITGQSFTVQSAEQSWTDRSPSHEINFSRVLSMRLKPVKARTKKGRLNIKNNLTSEEICYAASGLITDDSIPFFLDNYGPIREIWKYFLSARATARNAKDAVVVAFDTLYGLLGVGNVGLLQRFAYVHLADAIDALVGAVSIERDAGQVHRERGYRNECVYIDVYLTAKGRPVNDRKLRNELSMRKRIGVRLRQLVYPSPFLLAVYSDDAESIM
jgi:hypothetical protein